ncbi:MAG: thioredoxin [Calditrichaeota bacterium]|nr:MAG: thioredoxin [Calditrichota bacterium]
MVDFWAEWCAPCRMLGPVLEKLASQADGRWKLVKVNTDQHPELSMKYGVQGIPAVKMFVDGEVAAEFVGALPEIQVRRWLDENLPTESKKLLASAKAKLESQEKEQAKRLLEQVLESDPRNAEAAVLLAELIFETDTQRALALVENVPEEHPLHDRAQAIKTLAELISNQHRLAQQDDGSEAWRRYLAGIDALRNHNYEEALKAWIDALVVDKSVADDGPRRACVSLFTWLGQQHELTQKYHRAFTSALF